MGGQPVSMDNMKQAYALCHKYGVPLWIDACRINENAYFIKKYEAGYQKTDIRDIIKEIFSYSDGFHISLKKMLCNIGSVMRVGDKMMTNFPKIDVTIKSNQISQYSNDSQGGLSGKDLSAATLSLYDAVSLEYLETRISQTYQFGKKLKEAGVPIIWPPGGHAIYLRINDLFPDRKWNEFMGCGFVIELIKRYGIRGCELGYMAWELDIYLEENQGNFPDKMPPNYVRFAIPANVYGEAHFNYVV